MTESLKQLIRELFDYAGLFPPAGLEMGRACTEFARHLGGEHASGLARFVVPASRLEEFSKAGAALMPGTYATSGYMEHLGSGEPWRVSALVKPDAIEQGLGAIEAFNARHASEAGGLAKCDTIELAVPVAGTELADAAGSSGASFIDVVQEDLPDDFFAFFEIPASGDPRGMLAAISGTGTGAKLRTGGVEPGASPSVEEVSGFLHACAAAEVPFKCTAGLHHPVRGERVLTYEDDAPRGVQHGFLNVFLAACMVFDRGITPEETARLLATTDSGAFEFHDDGARWVSGGDRVSIGVGEIVAARQKFALSIGSCSYQEPLDDLRGLDLV